MLSILDRYLIREIVISALGVALVLLVILLGNTCVWVLGRVTEGVLPKAAVLPMIAISMVEYVTILLPISLYLGVLLAMGRLYRDNEVAACSACGMGPWQFYRPLLILTLVLMALSAWLALYIAPQVAAAKQLMKYKIEHRSELSGIEPGRFNFSKRGNAMMFVERFADTGDQMQQVFLSFDASLDNTGRVVESAASMQREVVAGAQKSFMVYRQGYLYAFPKEGAGLRITEFAEHGIEIREKVLDMPTLKINTVSTMALWRATDPASKAELHWRLALPLGCLLLALLALPLSYTTPRKGRYGRLALGILVYLIYSNLVGIGSALIGKGQVSSWLGMNVVHMGLFLLSGILLWQQSAFVRVRHLLTNVQADAFGVAGQ